MSDFRTYIPYVNRPDLLREAYDSILDIHPRVIDNSAELGDIEALYWSYRPPVPLTFSQTMNLILKMTREAGANICIFCHSDAVAGNGVGLKLLEEARRLNAEGRRWGVLWTHYDVLAAFNVVAFENIGGWDTILPQYYSDVDSYRRLRLAGWECIDTGFPVEHKASSTINSDARLRFLNSMTFPLYGEYYRKKWGGSPGDETFDIPFGVKYYG